MRLTYCAWQEVVPGRLLHELFSLLHDLNSMASAEYLVRTMMKIYMRLLCERILCVRAGRTYVWGGGGRPETRGARRLEADTRDAAAVDGCLGRPIEGGGKLMYQSSANSA